MEAQELLTTSITDNFLMGLFEFMEWAKWLFFVALIFVIADLKFGVQAARYRNEDIRRSRAVKRTVNKVCDYIVWIILGYTMGMAFGKPFGIDLLPFGVLLVIYGVELESIFKNYLEPKGKKVKINLFGLFNKKATIVEIEEDSINKKTDDNDNS